MPVPSLCTFALPADLRGREYFTACVREPLHDGPHVVGAAAWGGCTLQEVDEVEKTLKTIVHARTDGKLEREEMGALLELSEVAGREINGG
jgi:hypothetical protein